MRISDWSSDVCSSDLADQCGGGREADGQAPLAGGQAEPEGDMSLARAAGTERDDILAPLDPFATRQFQHLHLVELRDGGKVEAVETFDDRELRRLDAAFDLSAVALDQLPFGTRSEEHQSELSSLMRHSNAVL